MLSTPVPFDTAESERAHGDIVLMALRRSILAAAGSNLADPLIDMFVATSLSNINVNVG
jgi:hypothetical protein